MLKSSLLRKCALQALLAVLPAASLAMSPLALAQSGGTPRLSNARLDPALAPSRKEPAVADGVLVDNRAIVKYVNDTEIPAQADGIITNISQEEGGTIGEGDLLVEQDARQANAELLVAQRQLEAANLKAEDDSNMEYNALSLEVAKKQLEMFQSLFKKGASSVLELEKNKLEADKARLALKVAGVQNATDKKEAKVNEAKMHAAEVQVELRNITAPFNGVVAELKKHKNDWVRSGEPIVRLVGMEKLNVIGRLPIHELKGPAYLLENADAEAVITLMPGGSGLAPEEHRIKGKINFVSPVQDSEGMYRVKMQINNQKYEDSWVYREGMQVRLEVTQRSR